jgi:lipopolysaccharide biosynthesis glycosyltransferase
LNGAEKEDQICHEIIERFRNASFASCDREFNAIGFSSSYFSGFERFHLNRVTFQKLLIPHIFPEDKVCVCVDAGMIFGKHLGAFLGRLDQYRGSIIRAFSTPSHASLQQNQLDIPRHELYPAGGILVLDNELYLKERFFERSVVCFDQLKSRIVYGEQDLICFTARGGELGALTDIHLREHVDLASPDIWTQAERINKLYKSRDFFYLKHVGLFKPWLKWVLNPAKSIYLSYISSMPSDVYNVMEAKFLKEKHNAMPEQHKLFAQQELQRYEAYLSSVR